MDVTAVLNFLLIAGAIHGFIFNIATFLARKKIEKPVVFLNLFVFFLSLNNLQSWLIAKDFVFDFFFLKHFVFPWYVLIVPMFYAFLVHYLGIEKKRLPFVGLSITIFVIAVLARTALLVLVGKKLLALENVTLYNSLEDAIALLYSIFIFIKATRILYSYQELYQSILTFDDLKWIKRFIKLGGIIFVLWGIAVLLNIFSDTIKAPYSYYPLRLGSSILIYWIGYQAFFRYIVLKDRIVLRREIRKAETVTLPISANQKADISQKIDKQEIEFNQINSYVRDTQRYFDPYLSLEKLAEELHLSTSKLSMLVNQYSQQNFSDYINSMRVEDAKKLLASSDFEAYTIVSIGLECGFNSRSTFYSAFKKFTGQTPSAYRNEYTS